MYSKTEKYSAETDKVHQTPISPSPQVFSLKRCLQQCSHLHHILAAHRHASLWLILEYNTVRGNAVISR